MACEHVQVRFSDIVLLGRDFLILRPPTCRHIVPARSIYISADHTRPSDNQRIIISWFLA